MRIDHVILACADVDATAARLLADHGLGSVVGGEHPAWGTRNRLVPAGPAYVELMGVADPAVAEGNALGRWLLASLADGDRAAGLAVEPDDLETTADRLGLTVSAGSRTRPDGRSTTWRSAGMTVALTRSIPFFIAWDDLRGAEVEVESGAPAAGLVEVELGGDPEALRAWLGGEVPGLTCVAGDPGVRRLVVATRDGEVDLTRP